MVSRHVKTTSSKIVSTTSRVDLIFSQNPGKIWEIRPKREIQTPSIYFRANPPELSVEEQREAKPIAQFWTISVGLDSFPVKEISICCNFTSRFYCIFASSVNQPIARCCNFTSAEEPAMPKRSSSASGAFKPWRLYLSFLSASPAQCASFGTWQGPSPMGHTKISFCCILTSPFLLTWGIIYAYRQIPLHLSSRLASIFLRYCIFISSKGSLLSEYKVK